MSRSILYRDLTHCLIEVKGFANCFAKPKIQSLTEKLIQIFEKFRPVLCLIKNNILLIILHSEVQVSLRNIFSNFSSSFSHVIAIMQFLVYDIHRITLHQHIQHCITLQTYSTNSEKLYVVLNEYLNTICWKAQLMLHCCSIMNV